MKKVIMILVVVCYLIPCCHGEDMPVIEWSERTTHDSQLDQLFDNEMENDEQDNSSVLLDETRSLMQGDKGSRVLKLQEQLVKLGYLSGGAYGNYGPRTEEAVKKAQEAFGMEITGIADQEFLDRLYNIPIYETLYPGDKGSGVLKLQEKLAELGYISGGAYGNYGPRTEEAVKKAQEDYGMEQTGIADNVFLSTLFAEDAIEENSFSNNEEFKMNISFKMTENSPEIRVCF